MNRALLSKRISSLLAEVSRLSTMTRYPNELTVEEHHAKQAIAFAEQILNWTASALR